MQDARDGDAVQVVRDVLVRALGATPAMELAERRARDVAWAATTGSEQAQTLLGETLVAELLDGRPQDAFRDVVAEAARAVALERTEFERHVFVAALGSRSFFELPTRTAVELVLQLLVLLSELAEASLWRRDADARPRLDALVGASTASRRVRALAGEALAQPSADSPSARLLAIPVVQWDRTQAVVVVRLPRVDDERGRMFAAKAAEALVPILEKDRLLERNEDHERALVESTERRLVRLAFDLHDSALQDLAALAAEISFFRARLAAALSGDDARLLIGQVEDLAARVAAIERELRDLARSLESPALVRTPFVALVRRYVDELAATGVNVAHSIDGSVDWFTPSLRIALARLIEAAFENIRLHSGAQNVSLAIVASPTRVHVEITDDGHGFDVERTLVAAAQAGRLGIVGMSERIRLLGGRLDVVSRPGGPTTMFAVVPRWRESET